MSRADKFFKQCVGAISAGLICAGLLACSQGESNVAAGNREGVFHFGNGTEPQSLDPHVMSGIPETNIARALYEGLVVRNPITLELDPGVAKSWETSADGKVLTFHLRDNARWSNGDPVTAEDFNWSLRRALHPKMGYQLAYVLYPIRGAEDYAQGKSDDPETLGIEVLDPYTLRITLNNPDPFFLGILAGYNGLPVHRATVEAHGEATDRYSGWTRPENFVGNGPFVLTSWKLQRRIVTDKSETYWDADNVALNSVVFHPIDNETTEEKMFRVGQLHHTLQVPLNKIANYQQLRNSPYRQTPQRGTYYLMFNVEAAPVNQLKVRQALAMAIDRDALVNKVLKGTEQAHSALVPQGTPGYTSPDFLPYDPEGARQLLAEAGYPNGEGWPGLEYLFNTSENHRKIAVTVQQMWKDHLNIKVNLVNVEWKVYLDMADNKDYTLARRGWVVSDVNPATFLDTFISTSGVNNSGFSNARYDEIMLRLAPAAANVETRFALMQEAEAILLKDVPLIPLYNYNSKHLVQPSVKGAPPNPFDLQHFKYISLDPDAPVWKGEE